MPSGAPSSQPSSMPSGAPTLMPSAAMAETVETFEAPQAALNVDGNTITLATDIYCVKTALTIAGVTVTIEGAGFTVGYAESSTSNSRVFAITDGAVVTMNDMVI